MPTPTTNYPAPATVYARVTALAAQMGVTVRYKDQSLFMRLLGKLLFFTPAFMTEYTTTIRSTVYFPSEAWANQSPLGAAMVLAHELQHVQDSRAMTFPIYAAYYLFWWPGRTWVEHRGYAVSIATMVWRGLDTSAAKLLIEKQFTGPAYLYMDRDAARVKADIDRWELAAYSGSILTDLPLTAQLRPLFRDPA